MAGVPLAERFVRAGPAALAVLDDRGGRLGREALWREAGRFGTELAARGIVAADRAAAGARARASVDTGTGSDAR